MNMMSPCPEISIVMMYAMNRSSSLKKRTLPSHDIPITTVKEMEDLSQYL